MEPGAEPLPQAAGAVEANAVLSLPTMDHYNHLLEGLQRVAARVAEHDARIAQLSSTASCGGQQHVLVASGLEGAVCTQKQPDPAASSASLDLASSLQQQNQHLHELDQRMAGLVNHVASLSSIEELLVNLKKDEHQWKDLGSRISARSMEKFDSLHVAPNSRYVQEAPPPPPPPIWNGNGFSPNANLQQIRGTGAALSRRLQEPESQSERGILAQQSSSLTAERHDQELMPRQGSTAERLKEVVSLIRQGPAHAA
jgi:hypothetical protein